MIFIRDLTDSPDIARSSEIFILFSLVRKLSSSDIDNSSNNGGFLSLARLNLKLEIRFSANCQQKSYVQHDSSNIISYYPHALLILLHRWVSATQSIKGCRED